MIFKTLAQCMVSFAMVAALAGCHGDSDTDSSTTTNPSNGDTTSTTVKSYPGRMEIKAPTPNTMITTAP